MNAPSQGPGAAGPWNKLLPLALLIVAGCVVAAVPFVLHHPEAAPAEGPVAKGTAAPGHAPPGAPPGATAPPPPAACVDCGQVIDIRTLRTEGDSSGVGAVAGGVLGGVVGHQVGAGRGKEALTVLGAIGGALGGNQVEKQVKARTQYLVDVRMADGSTRTIAQATPPQLAAGEPVRVAGNSVVPR